MECDKIGLTFRKIHNLMECKMNRLLEQIDLTSSQTNVLFYLVHNKDRVINQRDIEKRFELSNPTVNGILMRLENKGFIRREVSKLDARNKEIKLTEKFYEIEKQMRKSAHQMQKQLIKDINKDELTTFCIVLEKIANNLKENENERNT